MKLFNGDKFDFYCARGEWKGKEAGGPIQYVRDKDKIVQDAQVSRIDALNHACPAVVIDGDVSWFRNPQFRMYATGTGMGEKTATQYSQHSSSINTSPQYPTHY